MASFGPLFFLVLVGHTTGKEVETDRAKALALFDPKSPLVKYLDDASCGPRGGDAALDASSCGDAGVRLVAEAFDNYNVVASIDGCDYFMFRVYECQVDEANPQAPGVVDSMDEADLGHQLKLHARQIDAGEEGHQQLDQELDTTLTSKSTAVTRCGCERPKHSTFPDCTESSECTCSGKARIGYGTKWSKWFTVAGTMTCSSVNFGGDPYPNQAKECQCEPLPHACTRYLASTNVNGYVQGSATEVPYLTAAAVSDVKVVEATMAGSFMNFKDWPTPSNGGHIYLKSGSNDEYVVKVFDSPYNKMVLIKLSLSNGKVHTQVYAAGYTEGADAATDAAVQTAWGQRTVSTIATNDKNGYFGLKRVFIEKCTIGYLYKHDGKCSNGWMRTMSTLNIDSCAGVCRQMTGCGYISYDGTKDFDGVAQESTTDGNCDMYMGMADCPDDNLNPSYHSWRVTNEGFKQLVFRGYASSGYEPDGGGAGLTSKSSPNSYLDQQCANEFAGSRAAFDDELLRLDKAFPSTPEYKDDDGANYDGAVVKCHDETQCKSGSYWTRSMLSNTNPGWVTSSKDWRNCNNWCDKVLCVSDPDCGNGNCETGETFTNCQADCSCGDGICKPPESYDTCPEDCKCGDGTCASTEDYANCPADCTADWIKAPAERSPVGMAGSPVSHIIYTPSETQKLGGCKAVCTRSKNLMAYAFYAYNEAPVANSDYCFCYVPASNFDQVWWNNAKKKVTGEDQIGGWTTISALLQGYTSENTCTPSSASDIGRPCLTGFSCVHGFCTAERDCPSVVQISGITTYPEFLHGPYAVTTEFNATVDGRPIYKSAVDVVHPITPGSEAKQFAPMFIFYSLSLGTWRIGNDVTETTSWVFGNRGAHCPSDSIGNQWYVWSYDYYWGSSWNKAPALLATNVAGENWLLNNYAGECVYGEESSKVMGQALTARDVEQCKSYCDDTPLCTAISYQYTMENSCKLYEGGPYTQGTNAENTACFAKMPWCGDATCGTFEDSVSCVADCGSCEAYGCLLTASDINLCNCHALCGSDNSCCKDFAETCGESNAIPTTPCPANSYGVDVVSGCTCMDGFAGTITATTIDPWYAGSCTAVACPDHARGENVGSGCTCELGYEGAITATAAAPYFEGSCSTIQCPLNSHGINVLLGCTCNPGFGIPEDAPAAQITTSWHPDTACEAVPCPTLSVGEDVPNGCFCEAGYAGTVTARTLAPYYINTCKLASCPGNASAPVEGEIGCVCDAGFTGVLTPKQGPPFYDGKCTPKLGCMHTAATNFDPTATVDDGSCLINGCMNSKASNYNDEATVDDSSCIVLGCLDPLMVNYDSEVTEDDGSCVEPAGVDCVGDWGEWTACSATCGGGTHTAIFSIKTDAAWGGAECGHVDQEEKEEDCYIHACKTCEDAQGGQDAAWLDSEGYNCGWYAANKCNAYGGYGSSWQPDFGTFAQRATGGMDATQACCDCGGGEIHGCMDPRDPHYITNAKVDDGSCILPCPDHSTGQNVRRGCTCNIGYSGSIEAVQGAPYQRGDCAAVECPSNSEGVDVGAGCQCKEGYSGSISATYSEPFYAGACAPQACPEGSTGVSIGAGCTCNAGYTGTITASEPYDTFPNTTYGAAAVVAYHTGKCEAVDCPEGSDGDSVPGGCTCPNGYSGAITAESHEPFYSGSCVSVGCPANSGGADLVSGCKCLAGFSGTIISTASAPFYVGECQLQACPDNAFHLGTTCVCSAGYKGTITPSLKSPYFIGSCVAVSCPLRSTGVSVTSGCTCNAGYTGTIVASQQRPYYTGTCEAIAGCMDATATNYNPEAVEEDNSCTFFMHILGCMDPVAANYNPDATKESGTCVYACTAHSVHGITCDDSDALAYTCADLQSQHHFDCRGCNCWQDKNASLTCNYYTKPNAEAEGEAYACPTPRCMLSKELCLDFTTTVDTHTRGCDATASDNGHAECTSSGEYCNRMVGACQPCETCNEFQSTGCTTKCAVCPVHDKWEFNCDAYDALGYTCGDLQDKHGFDCTGCSCTREPCETSELCPSPRCVKDGATCKSIDQVTCAESKNTVGTCGYYLYYYLDSTDYTAASICSMVESTTFTWWGGWVDCSTCISEGVCACSSNSDCPESYECQQDAFCRAIDTTPDLNGCKADQCWCQKLGPTAVGTTAACQNRLICERTGYCQDDAQVGPVRGCRNPYAANYNPVATIDDDSCTYSTCALEAEDEGTCGYYLYYYAENKGYTHSSICYILESEGLDCTVCMNQGVCNCKTDKDCPRHYDCRAGNKCVAQEGWVAPGSAAGGDKGSEESSATTRSGDGATVQGDPHVMNMQGEKFDVLHAGSFEMIHVPRGASKKSTLLNLVAQITRANEKWCESMFIERVSATGQWFGVQGKIEIAAGKLRQAEPLGFRVGVGKWRTHEEVSNNGEVAQEFDTGSEHKLRIAPVFVPVEGISRPAFRATVGPLTIQVSLVKHPHFQFLNLDVEGLIELGQDMEIGGMLGLDGHADAVVADAAQCAVKGVSNWEHKDKNHKKRQLLQLRQKYDLLMDPDDLDNTGLGSFIRAK